MPEPTPADELRAAARLLRDTASEATPGPWEDISTDDHGAWPHYIVGDVIADDPVGYRHDVLKIHESVNEEIIARADVAWNALAHPAIAEPLAAWLDAVAAEVEYSRRCGEWVSPKHPALAVARALNGETR